MGLRLFGIQAGLLIVTVFVGGCGPGAEERVAVCGRVWFQGELLTSGTIVFAPDRDRGALDEIAVGRIQPDGSYQLQNDRGDAIAPGWYRISIVASGPASPTLSRFPEKYRDPVRSGLQGQVRAGGDNVLDFHLVE